MPFHGVAPGKHVQPLEQIDLPVWFGTPANLRKETLTFDVVGFRGANHTILGRPCYAKFMEVPNYTYLKMKMSGPNGVITVGSLIEHAFDCDVVCVEHAEALALDEALVASMEKLVNEDLNSTAKHAGNFEAAEQTKEVPLDPAAPEGKALRLSKISAGSKAIPGPEHTAPRLQRRGPSPKIAPRQSRPPQAVTPMGGTLHCCQSAQAQHLQAGQRGRRGTHQRLEHPTATSLLHLERISKFLLLFTYPTPQLVVQNVNSIKLI
jgi:hypothetical protein